MPYGYTLHGRVQYIYIASYREWQAYNFVRTVYMVEVSVPPLPKTPFLTRESPSLTHVAIQFNEFTVFPDSCLMSESLIHMDESPFPTHESPRPTHV